jgi:DNA-binding transcriptional MerR regulator
MAEGLRIGEVAAKSGFSRKALLVYETRGILPAPRRTPAGYRVYPETVLGLLTFVGRARRLGLNLAEIQHIIAIRRAGSPCVRVRALIERKADDLQSLLDEMRGILRSWTADKACVSAVCPNLETEGGDIKWTKSSRSALRAVPAPKSKLLAAAPKYGSAKQGISPSSRRTPGTPSLT